MLPARDAAACRCGRWRATSAPRNRDHRLGARLVPDSGNEFEAWNSSEKQRTKSRVRPSDPVGLNDRFRRNLAAASRSLGCRRRTCLHPDDPPRWRATAGRTFACPARTRHRWLVPSTFLIVRHSASAGQPRRYDRTSTTKPAAGEDGKATELSDNASDAGISAAPSAQVTLAKLR
jgi:hypothetical protein